MPSRPYPLFLLACLFVANPAPRLAAQPAGDKEEVLVIEPPPTKLTADAKVPDLPKTAAQIVEGTNQFRKKEGRAAVTPNPKLTAAARDFAAYMARSDRYGHTADGKQPAGRAKEHGYDYCLVAENIAYQYHSDGFDTAELVAGFVGGWKSSPGHRQNMLDPDATETGVAVAYSDKTYHYFAVQLFGRPKAAAVEFQVVNGTDATVEYKIGERDFSLLPRYRRTHQECRPPEVAFRWPDKAASDKKAPDAKDKPRADETVRPKGGERYVVERAEGAFTLRKDALKKDPPRKE